MAVKKCVLCGAEFIDYGRGKYCHNPHFKTCKVCGKEFEYDIRAQTIPKTCSRKCASKLARTSNFQYKEKQCCKCGKTFIPTTGKQKYCSKECRI